MSTVHLPDLKNAFNLIKIHLVRCQFVRFYYISVGEMNDFRKLEKVRRIDFSVDASKQFHIKVVVQCYCTMRQNIL